MSGLSFKASSKAANAPELPDGEAEYLGKFLGVEAKVLEKSTFDPNVFIWKFALLDADKKELYFEGEPIEVEALTSQSTNVKSKTTPGAVKILKALMTKSEFASFSDEDDDSEPVKEADLEGRIVKLDVIIKDSGWPGVEKDGVRAYKKAA